MEGVVVCCLRVCGVWGLYVCGVWGLYVCRVLCASAVCECCVRVLCASAVCAGLVHGVLCFRIIFVHFQRMHQAR